jgi:hypothetical protein
MKISFILLSSLALLSLNYVLAIKNGYDGQKDIDAQFPYIVYTQLTVGSTTRIDQGVLIAPQYVLVAASAIYDAKNSPTGFSLSLKIGAYDPTKSNPNSFTITNKDDVRFI